MQIRVLHDLSVLHVVVILFTFCVYCLRINMDGWMGGWIIINVKCIVTLLSSHSQVPP